MAQASGVAKKIKYKQEVTYGLIPVAASSQSLRRVTCDIDLSKDTYESNEIREDRQVSDMRHGVRMVSGTLNGELSPGTYKDFIAASLCQAFQTAATTGAIITVTAASTSGAAGTFTRASGSYLTDGFKIGDIVTWTGWATTGVPNNSHNFMITALTALIMTGFMLDGVAVGPKAAGDSVTGVVKGKKTWVPTTGHTDISYSIESWYSDIAQSEVFAGCKVGQIDLGLPASGMATINIAFQGQQITTASSEYFTSPTAQTSTGVLAAVNGAVVVGGVQVANLTGLTLTINNNLTSDPVVGSNIKPFIFQGRVKVSGQMTINFENATMRDIFVNETETSLFAAFTTSNLPGADFVAIAMSRIKTGGATKDDGEKGLVMTVPFTALLNTAGGAAVANLATTISIQDSTA